MSNREMQIAHGTFSMGSQQHDHVAQEVIILYFCDLCLLLMANNSWEHVMDVFLCNGYVGIQSPFAVSLIGRLC